jgi:hypothetical protein
MQHSRFRDRIIENAAVGETEKLVLYYSVQL